MKLTFHIRLLFCLLFLPALACGLPTAAPVSQIPPTADLNAFNTAIALTAAAATPLPLGANTAIPPAEPVSDDEAINQALAAYLKTNAADTQFTVTANNGSTAYGVVVQSGAMEGAAWFAAKGANGQWVIVHVGQSWPPCAAIQPYNFPLDYVSHCEDANGNVIDRAAGGSSAPPSAPTVAQPTQADSFAPDPLGVAWTGFWVDLGACYDLDLFTPTTDAACDFTLDVVNTLVPRNNARFEGAIYQYAPSRNTCQSAALGSSAIDMNMFSYICFQTNAGKYGFLIPREFQANGMVFDAYLFP